MKVYDVKLTYPIQVKAKNKAHVKKIIMNNEHLGDIPKLELEITESKITNE